MKLAIGADEAGFSLKEKIKGFLESNGHKVVDHGVYDLAITANKIPGIHAAQRHDVFSAERAELSNNAQVITMGGPVIGNELAKKIAETWLNVTFKDGRSTPKVAGINEIDQQYHKPL
jgi:ribose 5-phosphate isomerase B